jgi:hypothetical protein
LLRNILSFIKTWYLRDLAKKNIAWEIRTMKKPEGRSTLGGLWNSIQTWLLPALKDEIGARDERHRQLVAKVT